MTILLLEEVFSLIKRAWRHNPLFSVSDVAMFGSGAMPSCLLRKEQHGTNIFHLLFGDLGSYECETFGKKNLCLRR